MVVDLAESFNGFECIAKNVKTLLHVLLAPATTSTLKQRMCMRQARDLPELLARFKHWLYLEDNEIEFIQIALAATLDREISGDPVWLFLVAPPGGMKTELIRALSGYSRAYSLDTFTPHTLISGKTRKNEETGEFEPIAGILQDLDGKVLLIKDFTSILSER